MGAPRKFPPRAILLNEPELQTAYNQKEKYVTNSVRTTKYTLLTFLPKNLFEQFRRVANFYFLITAAIQFIPNVSPLNPVTSFFPLAVVLAVTAVKEGVEDYRRYKSDVELNARPATKIVNGEERVVPWSDVSVGDILALKQDDFFPADMVVLHSTNPGGMCYIETSNLDGETNLKIKQSHPDLQSLFASHQAVSARKGRVDCEGPTTNLYNFEGTFVFPDERKIPLGKEQILLRGCVLKQTPLLYGLVVYTGHETKLFLNAGSAPSKRTSLEKHLNRAILFMMAFQMVVVGLSAAGAGVWHLYLGSPAVSWYLQSPDSSGNVGGFAILTYTILYNVMIPISLYVSMEMVKLAQVLFLGQDVGMYYPVNDTPAAARTSNLNEELGQIEYIFSDKTGTLTCNIMEFMKCTIAGIAYGRGITEIEAMQAEREGRKVQATKSKIKGFNFDDPSLLQNLNSGHPTALAIREFLTMLSVNHAVIPEDDPQRPGQIKYQAASPDENALVLGAKYLGYEFLRRTPRTVTITVNGVGEETYEILNLLEFSSKRKRSSVIVRTPKGELKLWCKGADNVIKERLDSARNDPRFLEVTDNHLEMFASQGLRTLCFAGTVLDPVAYEQWNVTFQRACTSLVNREKEVEDACELIEQNLVLIGATAIEDKLQDGVPEAIRILEDANIKVWMLTGDKQETAINIGYACNLIDNTFTQIVINAATHDAARRLLTEAVKQYKGVTMESAKLGLIIDGFTLTFVLNEEQAKKDAAAGIPTLPSLLSELSQKCRGVICCRMSPKQKAAIVRMVRVSKSPAPVTLSIGDGANDVPMIQRAHVGVGISGEEGLQAVRAADFAIAQFRFLVRLLLVHGRWDYKRIAKMVLYSFYKNMTFVMTLFWFTIFSGFSGTTLYNSWFISLFNVLFTGVPIIALAIFDQDVSDRSALKYPKLYADGQKGTEFSQFIYWSWITRGVYHSLVCFFVPFLVYGGLSTAAQSSDIVPTGQPVGLYGFGLNVFWCVVFVVTAEVALEHNTWTWINAVCVASAVVLLFAFSLIYCVIIQLSWDVYYVPYMMFTSGSFWFCILLSIVFALLPDYMLKYIKRNYFYTPYQVVQEMEQYGAATAEVEMQELGKIRERPVSHHTGYGFESPAGDDYDISTRPQIPERRNPLRNVPSGGSSGVSAGTTPPATVSVVPGGRPAVPTTPLPRDGSVQSIRLS